MNQLVFSQILDGMGLKYRIAGNGKTAVEMLRTLKPGLVLMDVSMPEMNGYEATAAIRELEAANGTHTPIIGITAHALRGDREKCLGAGMDDYLPKPISPQKLADKITHWRNSAQRLSESA
ncbi:response regulator [Nitratireductor sp.]|uniref:response regulator n=1 Tax=Nitratireductor sp. TaxID=1872084 RepID=UPI0025CF9328|nr:response regulator [Nitratireductor sp.]